MRSCRRSDRLLHQIIPAIVQICGIAARMPITILLLPWLKLCRICGVQMLMALRVLVRQK
ncbi:hypothetical protein D3C75_1370690 [compost metagenome]